jgi:hypothetical protein
MKSDPADVATATSEIEALIAIRKNLRIAASIFDDGDSLLYPSMKLCDLGHPLLPSRDVGLFARHVPGRRPIAGRRRRAKAAREGLATLQIRCAAGGNGPGSIGCLSQGHDDVQLNQIDQFWHLTTRQLRPLADIAAFQAAASGILTSESARHNETSLIFRWPSSMRSHS